MRYTPSDLAVATLSRRQHGVWSRDQAVARGMTPKQIRVRVESGEWVRLDTAVYAHVAAPATWDRSVMAAVLAEPWAVGSHRASAVLHALKGFRPGRPEITVRPGANARGHLAIVHRGVDLRTTTVRGIPTVTVAQTFVDLAQVVSARKVHTALVDRADSDPRVLGEVRDRYCALAPRGGRDLRPLRGLLDRFGAGEVPTRSALEERLDTMLQGVPGLPPLEWEAPFPGRSPGDQRVDVLLRPWRLVVEADGRAWHTRIEDFERDRRRDAEAAAAGYQTLRFTWHQVCHETRWVRRIVLQTGAERSVLLIGGKGGLLGSLHAPNHEAA